MAKLTPYERLVMSLYDAAIQPEHWRQSINRLAEWINADSFHFLCWNRRAAASTLNLTSDDRWLGAMTQYASHFGSIDPRRELVERTPVGAIIPFDSHFDKRFVEHDEFHQDFLKPLGVRNTIGIRLLRHDDIDVMLSLLRITNITPFSGEDVEKAERIAEHLQRAVKLWLDTEGLRQHSAFGGAGLDAMGVGAIGTDAHGYVWYANGRARSLLRNAECVTERNSRLVAKSTADDVRLQAALRLAADTGQASSMTVARTRYGKPECYFTVAPLRDGNPLECVLFRASVLVLICERDTWTLVTPRQLCQLFKLSPAESRLARAIALGVTPEEYATSAGISVATVRTQLRSTYAKTGASGQLDLVRLLLRIPAAG